MQELELLGGIYELKGERVLVLADTANFPALFCLYRNDIRLPPLALIGIHDDLTQGISGPAADRGKLRPGPAAASVHLVAGITGAFPSEDFLPGGEISRPFLFGHRAAQALQIGHQL